MLITGADEAVAVWDVETGALLREARLAARIQSLAFTAAGGLFAAETRAGLFLLRHAEPGAELARLATVPDRGTASFCFSRDGRQLAVQTDSGGAIVWELEALRRELDALGMAW
jgi:hypothetical protein